MMSGTFGRTGIGLSSTAGLGSLLASRLRRKTASGGTILYRTIWTEQATPAGRSLSALRASGWTGGAAPKRGAWNGPYAFAEIPWSPGTWLPLPVGLIRLLQSAGSISGNANTLSGWSTASARDWKDSEGMATMRPDGSRDRLDQLPRQALLAGWPTAMAGTPRQNGHSYAGNNDQSRNTMALVGADVAGATITPLPDWGPARMTIDGEILTGCSAGMESGGLLDPEHSRWLMRIPAEWARYAPTETPSTLKRQQRS